MGATPWLPRFERAHSFHRFKAADVRSILEAGQSLPWPRPAGEPLPLGLPEVERRPLAAYALEALR